MTTYGMCIIWHCRVPLETRRIILTKHTSLRLHIYGSSNVYIHDMCHAHECGVYTNLFVPVPGFYIIVIRLLANGPRRHNNR